MTLLLVGINHKSAPVEVRERYAPSWDECVGLNEKLVQHAEIEETAVLATCNRTELLVVASDPDTALERMHGFLRDEVGDGTLSAEHVVQRQGEHVARHLFGVAASLDSMVLGEAQILGQVKDAYRASVVARTCGPILNRLFHRAFRTAKEVRSSTGLGASPVSVARVGVQLAREIFETFDEKSVLLLGAGEMAESALYGFRDAGVRNFVVVNRSQEPARALALRLNGRAAPLDALEEELAHVDAAVTSIAVDRPLVREDTLRSVMRRRQGRPLLLIDLGLPRNVDPVAAEVAGTYLYDMDDLEAVAERGRSSRAAALPDAEAIVERHLDRFERWRTGLSMVPTIRELIAHAQELARREVARSRGRIGTMSETPESADELEAALERMGEAIVAKLLHRPLQRLRAEAEEGNGPYYAEAVRDLFGLEDED